METTLSNTMRALIEAAEQIEADAPPASDLQAIIQRGDFRPEEDEAIGYWFARERLLANSLFMTFAVVNVILIIVGTFFRGPNWALVSPF